MYKINILFYICGSLIQQVMGRKPLTDGTKKKQVYFLIEENKLKKIGKQNLFVEFNKMVEKLINNIEKGKHPNQVNLLDSIAEIENQKK